MSDRKGFRVGIAVVMAVLLALGVVGIGMAQENAARSYLGVRYTAVEDGARIAEVIAASPAETAGLQVDDVITAVDGQAVTADSPLADLVRAHQPGDAITLSVRRGDETLEIVVTLGSAPEAEPQAQAGATGFSRQVKIAFAGLELQFREDGLEVTDVADDSLAADLLRVGDRITTVNGDPASGIDPDDLARLVEEGGDLTLGVMRGGEEQTVTLTLEPGTPISITQVYIGSMPGMMGPQGPMGFSFLQMGANRGYLGVAFRTITAELADSENLPVQQGALIEEVQADSPAEEAGLQVGDIITAVNDEPVDEEHTLADRLYAHEPEDTVTLTVLREGETLSLDVTLGERPGGYDIFTPGQGEGSQMFIPFGMFGQRMNADEWRQWLEDHPGLRDRMERLWEQFRQFGQDFDWQHWLEMLPQLPGLGSSQSNPPAESAPAIESIPA